LKLRFLRRGCEPRDRSFPGVYRSRGRNTPEGKGAWLALPNISPCAPFSMMDGNAVLLAD
jgi:hypothetical protein